MAANIEYNSIKGTSSFVENGGSERKNLAWHGLGQVFDRPMFVKEALEASNADFQVGLQPVLALTPELIDAMANDKMINAGELLSHIISGRKTTMRLDNNASLGIVSDTYGVVQNADAFKFIDMMCTGLDCDRDNTPVIETAGVLGNGERIFVTAKFPNQIKLDNRGNDLVDMYMVFTTSHDGTGAVNCMVTPIRVVCNNTLNLAFRNNSGKLSLRHSSKIMNRLDLTSTENANFAYKALNLFDVYEKSLKENFEHLKNIKVSDKELDNILAEVLLSDSNYEVYKANNFNIEHEDISTRGKNLFLSVKDCMQSGVGQEIGERGTALWAINGLTSYYQNECKDKDLEYKFESQCNGNIQSKVQKAFELLVA